MDRALVGMRGLRLRVFSHFRPCLASRAAHGTKSAESAGALVSWRRSARRRQSPRRRWPRRPPTSAARWPPSPGDGHHLTAIPRSARPPASTRSRHRRCSRNPVAVLRASRRPTRPVRGLERLLQAEIGPATGRLRAAGNCRAASGVQLSGTRRAGYGPPAHSAAPGYTVSPGVLRCSSTVCAGAAAC